MNIEDYLSSGILDVYCMGALTPAQEAEVKALARQYPQVQREIDEISESLSKYATACAMGPAKETKAKVFRAIYESEAGPGKEFPPLINTSTPFHDIAAWVREQGIPTPVFSESAHLHELPGDDYVTNFLAWVKDGHPEEIHEDYLEYLVVLEGACGFFRGSHKTDYKKGDIIEIEMNQVHNAVVTSKEPMLVLVQRQFI